MFHEARIKAQIRRVLSITIIKCQKKKRVSLYSHYISYPNEMGIDGVIEVKPLSCCFEYKMVEEIDRV